MKRSLAAAVAVSLVTSAVAQTPAPAPVADIVVNMRGVEIADVAAQISRITGRTIILDPAVKGTVNVTSASPLTQAGVWDLFQSVLRGQGYSVVRNGRAWRVVPQATAVREPSSTAATGRVITRMIRLENLAPDAAVRIFKPLVAAFGSVEAVATPRGVVVTDYADNVQRIESLARSLDGNHSNRAFDMINVQYASAKDVAAAIESVLGSGETSGTPRAVADERSNVVLVRGDARMQGEARRIALMLDKPNGFASVTKVFRLQHNDAEAVTAVLRGIVGEGKQANNPVARSASTRRTRAGAGTDDAGADGGTDAAGAESNSGESEGTAMSTGFTTAELAVEPAPELNAIVVRGSASAIAAIEPIIADLDVRRPQVLIEAAIVEVTGDRSEQLGIQLGVGAMADAVTNSAGTSFTNLGLSLQQVLTAIGAPVAAGVASNGLSANFGSRGDFGILVQALGQSTRANLLSTPSITTLDNRPAEIVVGQNVPFRTGSYATDGNTTTPFTTIERTNVGIKLRVIPRVHEGNTVRLSVSQEVSSLLGTVAGAADLITSQRSIDTTVIADDGQTIVLGGLISDDSTRTKSQVPVLGDIPVLGELFKSRRESKTRRTLFIFLKPTILRDSASVAKAAAERYERVRNAESALKDEPSLLLEPPQARLPSEIKGIY